MASNTGFPFNLPFVQIADQLASLPSVFEALARAVHVNSGYRGTTSVTVNGQSGATTVSFPNGMFPAGVTPRVFPVARGSGASSVVPFVSAVSNAEVQIALVVRGTASVTNLVVAVDFVAFRN